MEALLPDAPAALTNMIEEIERYANGRIEHERFVFEQGYNFARRQDELAEETEINLAKSVGYVFLSLVREMSEGFTAFAQLRVGRNSMQELTVFAVLPDGNLAQLEDVRDIARLVEESVWNGFFKMVSIWTVTDGDLDQHAVAHDFPWVFTKE